MTTFALQDLNGSGKKGTSNDLGECGKCHIKSAVKIEIVVKKMPLPQGKGNDQEHHQKKRPPSGSLRTILKLCKKHFSTKCFLDD